MATASSLFQATIGAAVQEAMTRVCLIYHLQRLLLQEDPKIRGRAYYLLDWRVDTCISLVQTLVPIKSRHYLKFWVKRTNAFNSLILNGYIGTQNQILFRVASHIAVAWSTGL